MTHKEASNFILSKLAKKLRDLESQLGTATSPKERSKIANEISQVRKHILAIMRQGGSGEVADAVRELLK